VPGAVATSIIVFGRGLDADADRAGFRLSRPSTERVDALTRYVGEHTQAFGARRGRIVFSGGWAAAADGATRPPRQYREGQLMLRHALAADIAGAGLSRYADAYPEIESDSTLENVLRVHEAGYFDGSSFTARNPLGLVAHAEHLARIGYLVRKVFGLPGDAIVGIAAPGADARSGGLPEGLLLLVTRLALSGARGHDALRRRHRVLVAGNHRLRSLGSLPRRHGG
jgi:DUF218 domain